MTLTSIEAVRLKSSDRSAIEHEAAVATGDSITIKLKNTNILLSPAPLVRKNSVLLTEGADYDIDYVNGLVTFDTIPAVNDELDFVYYWSLFTDDEIQYFLDAHSGSIDLATAGLLLAWAADAAKLAKRQTLSGGGGLGQVVIDTSVVAKELRATAKALIDSSVTLANDTPAEGFTTIPWTEAMFRRGLEEHILDEN